MPVEPTPPPSALAASTLDRAPTRVRTSSASAPTSTPGTLLAAYRVGLFPMGVGAARGRADRVVVTGPARHPAAG